MKFSFTLLKKLVPGLKNIEDTAEKLSLYSFEVESAKDNTLDINISANRFSDAASHWGISRELSAILGKEFKPPVSEIKFETEETKPNFNIVAEEKDLCPRYIARFFENIKVEPSPRWMQEILIDCGLRPVSNVVDIANYAMLETGQPLHAFDFDKIGGRTIKIRRGKKGERITTLENKTYDLNEDILVIADNEKPLAIAGIKGGKTAEVDTNTKKIIIEAASFERSNIYKTSKNIKLITDASLRFSHNLSSALPLIGLNRVSSLLEEVIGAKPAGFIDINFTKPSKKLIKFDINKFNRFIGVELDVKAASRYLSLLGFGIEEENENSFIAEVPLLREDIETFEDLTEEVGRLYGYDKLEARPPRVHLISSGFEDQIVLKDKIKGILINAGLSEVRNYSWISQDEGDKLVFGGELVELRNPISKDFYYLRPALSAGLLKNIKSNARFFDDIRIFEIGKTFAREDKKITERLALGIAFASQNKETFFDLKGLMGELFRKIGLVDYLVAEAGKDRVKDFTGEFLNKSTVLKIESDNIVFGYLGQAKKGLSKYKANFCEIDLDVLLKLVMEEHEYKPLPKYPSIMRDVSVLVDQGIKVGDIMQAIQEIDLKYINDVDLIDEYEFMGSGKNKSLFRESKLKNLTFRIVFQAEDRTLTDEEVNSDMEKVIRILERKFRAKIR